MASSHVCFDVESQRPPQLEMSPEPVHMAAANIDSSCDHPTVPKSGEQLFSKLLCWSCSIGEVLGPKICGAKEMFICYEAESGCGLDGPDGCIKGLGSCEGMMPKSPFKCGCFEKFFCLKCGCTNPLEKPFVVVLQKEVVG